MSTDLSKVPLGKLTKRFVELRDRKRALVEAHKKALQPYDEALSALERAMLAALQAEGASSVKTPHGVVYTYPRKTCSIVDFDALWEHVYTHNSPELLQRRVSLSEVEAFNESHPDEPVPGLHIETVREARVRKS